MTGGKLFIKNSSEKKKRETREQGGNTVKNERKRWATREGLLLCAKKYAVTRRNLCEIRAESGVQLLTTNTVITSIYSEPMTKQAKSKRRSGSIK